MSSRPPRRIAYAPLCKCDAPWQCRLSSAVYAKAARVVFGSDQSANPGSFSFTGYVGAAQITLGGGYFEIVPLSPVPEPSTYLIGLLTLLALGYTQRSRLTRLKRQRRVRA